MNEPNEELESARVIECATEVENALIATLDDLQPKLMAKYRLSKSDVAQATAASTFRAAVEFAVRNSDVPEANVDHLLNHVLFMVQGCLNSWARQAEKQKSLF